MLRDAGLHCCFVSIHSPDSVIHDELTQVPGAFHQTWAGLANLEAMGIHVTTDTVICKQNYDKLDRLITSLSSAFPSITEARLSYPNIQGAAYANLSRVVAPLWEVAPFVRSAIAAGDERGIIVDTESIPLCLLGGHTERASELQDVSYHLSDLSFTDRQWRRPKLWFYKLCEDCLLMNQCCGIHTRHHEAFGTNACFTPVSIADIAQ